MKFSTSNKPLNIFSYSSLTDIVMLLLIFFLLTSQFVIQTGVKVKLPGSQNNEQVAPSNIVVSITAERRVFVGTEETSLDALAGKLSLTLKNSESNNLVIRADKEVNIDMVIKVIDAAKGIGIDKFTIETEKESF
ncbi:MAG: biopolymer transporter ExbD [Melioribacteraceae bacterium]|nr:biopolymer transporter ExbD [Melioribacteraceae bacterium]MCF8354593.1 biopolymer transporter ExbD [Melioribacteraceae bacterium]MCF8394945.1 biopolymer transporter ExbD [Melioribacteraceae bacterium]MCF8420170.1 biopolymer transporter ExbD [Melioribacteraceae bacterium]